MTLAKQNARAWPGMFDTGALKQSLVEIAKQRLAEADGAERTMVIGTPQTLTENSSAHTGRVHCWGGIFTA